MNIKAEVKEIVCGLIHTDMSFEPADYDLRNVGGSESISQNLRTA